MSDLISRQMAIDTEGLDEEIRCEICRNPMHTSRGCDGNCKYDEKLYEKIMQILDRRIKHVPSVQPDVPNKNSGDMISRRVAIVQLSHNKTGDDDCDVVIQNDIETIKALPSAQPEIIRCKDCKHKGTRNCVANTWATIFGFGVQDDFYCGLAERAERRTDG